MSPDLLRAFAGHVDTASAAIRNADVGHTASSAADGTKVTSITFADGTEVTMTRTPTANAPAV